MKNCIPCIRSNNIIPQIGLNDGGAWEILTINHNGSKLGHDL